MIVRAAAVLCLSACHAPAPRSETKRPPYLALFERGRRWSLPIESAAERGTLHCEVAEVKQVGDGTVARVTCAKPHAALLIVGTWVATPTGLYHPLLPIDDPDELALLGEDDLLLASHPKERQHSHVIAGAQDSIEAFTFHASWCVRDTTAAQSDRRSYTLCFDATGMTGGDELVIVGGQAEHRTRFGAAPPVEADDHEE